MHANDKKYRYLTYERNFVRYRKKTILITKDLLFASFDQ